MLQTASEIEERNVHIEERRRTASEVIDLAIAENRPGERLLYGFSIVFVGVGLSVLIWSMVIRAPILGACGTLASALFWPAMTSARRTRKETLAIRLLEAPLSRADTAKEAAEMLQHLFREIFRDKQQDGAQTAQKPKATR